MIKELLKHDCVGEEYRLFVVHTAISCARLLIDRTETDQLQTGNLKALANLPSWLSQRRGKI